MTALATDLSLLAVIAGVFLWNLYVLITAVRNDRP